MKSLALLTLLCATPLSPSSGADRIDPPATPRAPKLKIYLLAGQSNMEGKGHVRHITWLKDNARADERKIFHRVHRGGKFHDIKRVYIRYKNRIGKLNVGWGTNRDLIGPEYGFGLTMAEEVGGPILLLKVSEGGKTLKTEFLPPSSGGPGRLYKELVDMAKDAKSNLKKYVPSYGGQGYRFEGLVWFQGFNDNIDKEQKAEGFASYASRLHDLIHDLRSDLDAPDMKMVIGQLGFNKSPTPFNKAQMSVASRKGNTSSVRYVPIADLADAEVLKRYKTWKQNPDEWGEVGSDRPYHYYGSFLHFFRFGRAFAHGMLEMTPRFTMASIRKMLDKQTAPLHRALAAKKYVEAHTLCAQLKERLAEDAEELYGGDAKKLETANEVFAFLESALHGDLDDAIATLREHDAKGDVYRIERALEASAKKYAGIDEYDEVAESWVERFADRSDRTLREQVRVGKTYYGLIDKLRKKRTKGRLKALEKFATKHADSVYGKAAGVAFEQLSADEAARARDGGSYLK